jgi:hypothetical protein
MTVQEAAQLVEDAMQEARAPIAARPDSLTVQDLLDLWHGDEHSYGYPHPALARAVCRIVKPPTLALLCTEWLWPDVEPAHMPLRQQKLAAVGFKAWWDHDREKDYRV